MGDDLVRKVSAATDIITVAVGGAQGPANFPDGVQATSVNLGEPSGIVVDSAGNLYVAELYSAFKIYKVDASGIITTKAGTGFAGYSGDGGPATKATLFGPELLAMDSSGNLYIADSGNNAVRRVDAATGVITTYAGNGYPSFSGVAVRQPAHSCTIPKVPRLTAPATSILRRG